MTDDIGTLRDLYSGLKTFARQQGGNELRDRYTPKPDAAPVQGADCGERKESVTGEGEGSADDIDAGLLSSILSAGEL